MSQGDAPGARKMPGTLVSDYEYALPPELIAQYPTARRDDSRLLVLGADGSMGHGVFRDVAQLFAPGDLLVVNESRVFPARLLGHKSTGAAAEVLLIRPLDAAPDATRWEALVRPGRKLKSGSRVIVGDDLSVEVMDVLPSGNRSVKLETTLPVDEAIDCYGHVPLPPYIDRGDEGADLERYQTVYARERGSIAAPTAGLHFTDELLAEIEAAGVGRTAVTLHVGIGTFRPVEVDDPLDHVMHEERYAVSPEAADAVNRTRAEGGRVWAVGTTAVRTLESVGQPDGTVRPASGDTRLFIRPPYDFRVVDGLITNFHLPRSTLLMLVAALAGHERTMAAYAEAVRERYRFYSYGDAMAVVGRPGRQVRSISTKGC